MNSKLLHLTAVLKLKCLHLLGTFGLAIFMLIPLDSYADYECLYDSDFSNNSLYDVASNDCDSNSGTFGIAGGRFTVNDKEGLICDGPSGNADNELTLNTITGLDEYRNITLTFDYTIRDDSDSGFECTSVFGNGDDLIFMDVTVNGITSRVEVFCEDTPGQIEEAKRVQVAIPNGPSLNITIYAGTQAPSEFFYFDRIRICGDKIDNSNPPIDPPPPDPVMGETFEIATKAVRCKSSDVDLIPSLMSSIYSSFNDGVWFDSEGEAINDIIPSSPDLLPGDNLLDMF